MSKLFKLGVCAVDRPEENPAAVIDNCVAAIAEAGERGADFLVMPEEPDVIAGGTYGTYAEDAHPAFLAFQKQAAASNIGVVFTLSVKAGADGHANTAFVLDRDGSVIGRYRKKHPAPSEESIDTTPLNGDPFPVFEFEGVKLGVAICMDIHFPEMFRIYGLKGADLICMSTMYLDYTGDMLESLEKARAIDSQAYFALSRYITRPFLAGKNMGYAKIISPDGRIISSTAHRPGVSIAEIDPKWRMEFWGEGYEGNMRYMFDVIRRPDLYGELTEEK
jgi:nitrilase